MTSQAIWAVDTFSFSEQFGLTQNIFLMQPSVMVAELRCNNEGVWVGKGAWVEGGGWVGRGWVGWWAKLANSTSFFFLSMDLAELN